MALDEKLQQEFNELERTFSTPGWHFLKNGWQEEYNALPEIAFENVKTMEELNEYRERRRLLHQLIGLPEDVAQRQEELLEQDNE
jgi:hypothetical protein